MQADPEDLRRVVKDPRGRAEPDKGKLNWIPLFDFRDFRDQWLFAKVAPGEYFNTLYDLSDRCLEYFQQLCRKEFGEREEFVPHITLAKVKKGISVTRVGITNPSSNETSLQIFFEKLLCLGSK